MAKVKEICKYIVNALTIINALLIGLAPIWGWSIDKVIETIALLCAVISTYLLGNKAINLINRGEQNEE